MPRPNVTAGEISGHFCNIPSAYSKLAHTLILRLLQILKLVVHYDTSVNKRAYPFYELEHNPLNLDNFDS